MRTSLAVVLAFAALTVAAPPKHTVKVKEAVNVPRGWTKREAAPRDLTIDLRIALPQSNFLLLEQHLWEIRSVSISTVTY